MRPTGTKRPKGTPRPEGTTGTPRLSQDELLTMARDVIRLTLAGVGDDTDRDELELLRRISTAALLFVSEFINTFDERK